MDPAICLLVVVVVGEAPKVWKTPELGILLRCYCYVDFTSCYSSGLRRTGNDGRSLGLADRRQVGHALLVLYTRACHKIPERM